MNPSIQHKLERLAERFTEITALMVEPEIQMDQARFRALGQEYAQLEPVVLCFQAYQAIEDDLASAQAMLGDAEMAELAREEMDSARGRRAALEPELQRLLIPPDPHDQRNVFLEVRAGTGGAEAALFAADLMRMYLRYSEMRGWRVEQVNESEGELGGFKEVVLRISGSGVYSRLKFESGAHRVQRVPETESQGRIHTSACTIAILPEVEAVDGVDIDAKDLRIDTYRSSGAGGQHVNKTDSAVRITHLPSGIVVSSQNERSQQQNRHQCWKMMVAKLQQVQEAERLQELRDLGCERGTIGWGHQIRSYVLQPAQLVTDLRSRHKEGNADKVLNGDIQDFIDAYLQWRLKAMAVSRAN